MNSLVDVALPLPFDKTFTYRIPSGQEGTVHPGARLRVPFGGRSLVGVAVAFPDHSDVPRLKPVTEVLDPKPFLTGDLWETVRWMADYYACSLGEAAAACLPPVVGGRGRPPLVVRLRRRPRGGDPEWDSLQRRAPRQADLVLRMEREDGWVKREHLAGWGFEARLVDPLRRKGWLEQAEEPVAGAHPAGPRPVPTPDQERVLGPIVESVRAGGFASFLLEGVTSSGKTEVYLLAIEEALARGRTALFLIPEISLAPQTFRRIEERFGAEVGVLHSRLTGAERYRIWKGAREGTVRIVVGARSAVFAPLPDLGLVVVDEEHDTSYKQEEKPRYHARNVALVRASHAGATVVLGSATPSLESLENVNRGKHRHLLLPRRVGGGRLPSVRLVDLTGEPREQSEVFSGALIGAIQRRLERREQVILLLNRRGHSNFLQCRQCGWVKTCRDCDISLTYHRTRGRLLCHYCGASYGLPERCPECGSSRVSYRGYGTQRVEQELLQLFPSARVVRMDVDTTRGKRSFHEILDRFGAGAADILLGTQMVAKGHHFPGVSLVGVIGADQGLNFPDFRSAERTMQLLLQVAGRAGRTRVAGEVVVQTYSLGHPVFEAVRRHDYGSFVETELEMRRSLAYPPATRLALVTVQGPGEEAVESAARRVAEDLRGSPEPGVRVLGPVPAVLSRVRGRYRWQILIKGNLPGPAKRRLRERIQAAVKRGRGAGALDWSLNVDPEAVL